MLDTQNFISEMQKQPNFFYSQPFTLPKDTRKVLPFYDFRFNFCDKFCSPYLIINFLRIFNPQNRNRNLKRLNYQMPQRNISM